MSFVKRIMDAMALGAALLLGLPSAQAAYIVTFSQVGPDVVASGSGAIDLDGLTPINPGFSFALVFPATALVVTGAAVVTELPGVITTYGNTISGPSSFGPGGFTFATLGTGDMVGVQGSGSPLIIVPTGYVSGAPLSTTSTYAGQTIAGLGLTLGSYVYSFGSGADADTFTVNIGAVPEPASLTLLGAAVVGFSAVYRRRRAA